MPSLFNSFTIRIITFFFFNTSIFCISGQTTDYWANLQTSSYINNIITIGSDGSYDDSMDCDYWNENFNFHADGCGGWALIDEDNNLPYDWVYTFQTIPACQIIGGPTWVGSTVGGSDAEPYRITQFFKCTRWADVYVCFPYVHMPSMYTNTFICFLFL